MVKNGCLIYKIMLLYFRSKSGDAVASPFLVELGKAKSMTEVMMNVVIHVTADDGVYACAGII